ncbi:fluoride efflux transporter CrcB [Stappia sp. F7233]|uniref:Fluoride-specific ion channel FluC n=1 Tax=Stappia albiluteola TaxID=2758565 RepID=A0A839AEF2_9HYPH|nr:fluoride efflux transporter CrcB [Stappia albiluteola]MBA5777941.1 fluoride efflux transporter CrcB [Stappia albiluteola]
MQHLLLVMLGGGIGAGLRHLVGMVSLKLLGPGYPYATLTVNLVGSFAMGVFIGWLAARSSGDQAVRYFFATGVLGGFTTFSAFSLDFATLWERGQQSLAISYAGLSVAGALLAIFAGLSVVRLFGH